MADVSKLNGYDIKDAVARANIDSLEAQDIYFDNDIRGVLQVTDVQSAIDELTDRSTSQSTEIANKMDKSNPTGTGSFSLNRKAGTEVGTNSVAEGNSTTASAMYTHAEGQNTTASGNMAHAEGNGTTASNRCTHTEGENTTASGGASHAEGSRSTASGGASHAEGGTTTASGYASHAEGQSTTASGGASHAEGQSTKASSLYQHVQGRFNVEDSEGDYADIVGWGTANSARKNISALTTGGDLRLKGDLYTGCNDDSTGGSALSAQITNLNTTKEAVANKVTAITASSTDTQYPSAKAVYDMVSSVGKRYGFRRTKAESSPTARITYLYDAVGMTPAYMDFSNSAFSWGDWKNFVESFIRPVMLNTDGTVAYELDHDDQTKKLDGTASDIANTSFDGNAMVEFGKGFRWVKRYEDDNYEYVIFSNVQYDSDYHAYAHTNLNGTVEDVFYLGMFTSQNISNVFHSFGANASEVLSNAETQISYSKANGTGYNILDNMKWNFVIDLLILLSKSDNLQNSFGNGNTSNSSAIANGSLNNKGCFYGSLNSTTAVKTLWIENIWGNLWQRLAGIVLNCNNLTIYTKTNAPYCDTPVSAADYSNYNSAITLSGGVSIFVKNAYCNSNYGYIPTGEGGGSATTYFCAYFSVNPVSGYIMAIIGGCYTNTNRCGRYIDLYNSASATYNVVSSRLAYTPV